MNNNNGLSRTRLYTIFSGMKQRCYNPKTKNFNWYGGRGIAICDEWMGEHGVSNFIEWALNNGYEEHLTIDRIDPNGDYSPTNCQWITQSDNSSRARHTAKPRTRPSGGDNMSASSAIKKRLEDIGMTQTQLAEALGTNRQNLGNKLRRDNFTAKELERISKIIGLKLTMTDGDPGRYAIEYIDE